MKKLVTNENPFILANIREILEQADIACSIKNEFASSGSGELPHFDLWPELWVLTDSDWERAQAILADITENSLNEEWICSFCQENNAGSFAYCWNCQSERTVAERRSAAHK